MGWLRLVGSLRLQVSFAKEPYKRDCILQERFFILRSLLIVATPYVIHMWLIHMWCDISYTANSVTVCISIVCVCLCVCVCDMTQYTWAKPSAQRQPAIFFACVCVTWLFMATYREPRDCVHFKWLCCHGKIDFKYSAYAAACDPCVHVYTYRFICIWVSSWSHMPCV